MTLYGVVLGIAFEVDCPINNGNCIFDSWCEGACPSCSCDYKYTAVYLFYYVI